MRLQLRMEGHAQESLLTAAQRASPDVERGGAQDDAVLHRPYDAALLDHEQARRAVTRSGDVDRAAESSDDLVEGDRNVARCRCGRRGDRAGRSGDETAGGERGGDENPTDTPLWLR